MPRIFAVLVLSVVTSAVRANLDRFIEDAVRGLRQGSSGTDESYFPPVTVQDEYDFVVIGAGPGGSVVSNRLSEIKTWTVLLLENGQEESILLDAPLAVHYAQQSVYNWGYRAESQNNTCMGMEDGMCSWPRGNSLGGSTSIGYMLYARGNKIDYDLWSDKGNTGWSWDQVLPYFLKSENMRIKNLKNFTQVHNSGGYLNIETLKYKTPLGRSFHDAGTELGYQHIDYNNGEPGDGFSWLQVTMKRGHRQSAAKAFLRPIKHRSNLHISTKTRVTKILIDPDTKTAYGVEYVKNRRTYVVRARKEVILSAGALNSPQLLMLSGVGPAEHLKEFDIPVIQDLRVGDNLQEHVSYSGLTFLVNQTYVGLVEHRVKTMKTVLDWLTKGLGPITLPAAIEGLAHLRSKTNPDQHGRPDIQLIFTSKSFPGDTGRSIKNSMRMREDVYNQTFRPVEGRDSWTILPFVLRPKSRGCVRLQSKDPWIWPLFYANYFQDESDLDMLVEGIKMAIEISKTRAFQQYGSYLNLLPIAGCEQLGGDTDEYWRCAVRQLTTTLHHQSGTCKMGPQSDPTSVVSPELKVHGVDRLRVVDASIIPELVTAHTTAPTYMIGEKASDMIKDDWNATQEIEMSSSTPSNSSVHKSKFPPMVEIDYDEFEELQV